jgi:hypothetical protein
MARLTGKRKKQRPQVGRLGKELTRRSRGRCELCHERDDVRPFELWPFPDEPEMERTLMGCGRCRRWLEEERIDPVQARFLSEAVWAELAPVRLAAARMLLSHDDLSDPWLADAIDAANVDPVTLEFRVPPA